MKKKISVLGVILVVLIVGLFLVRPYLVDVGIRSQAEAIGNRFHHELLNDGKMHVIMVGTGTPNANPRRVQSSLAVIVDGVFVLIDVGAGAAQQADMLGLPLSDLKAVFLTHLHSDHISVFSFSTNIGEKRDSIISLRSTRFQKSQNIGNHESRIRKRG